MTPRILTEIKQVNFQTNGHNHTPTSTPLPFCAILNPIYINERQSATLKLKGQSKNVENITYIMGYNPRVDRKDSTVNH